MDSGGRDEKLVLNSLVSRDGTSRYRGRNVMAFCLRRAYFFTSSKVVPQVICLSLEDIQGQVFLFQLQPPEGLNLDRALPGERLLKKRARRRRAYNLTG